MIRKARNVPDMLLSSCVERRCKKIRLFCSGYFSLFKASKTILFFSTIYIFAAINVDSIKLKNMGYSYLVYLYIIIPIPILILITILLRWKYELNR